MYTRGGKRLFDLVLTIPAIAVLLPAWVVLSGLVRWKLGAPVLFRQKRPGKDAKPFTVYKFRTMINKRDPQGYHLPDEERLPTFGKRLRSTSLDELPELFNVLAGSMSLVGPRPLLMQYVDRYSPEQRRRLEVRPGITGWAQINGRNTLSWDEKFALDVWYVDHASLWLDLKIIFLTVWKVLRRENISQAGHATMPEFMGSSQQSEQSS